MHVMDAMSVYIIGPPRGGHRGCNMPVTKREIAFLICCNFFETGSYKYVHNWSCHDAGPEAAKYQLPI